MARTVKVRSLLLFLSIVINVVLGLLYWDRDSGFKQEIQGLEEELLRQKRARIELEKNVESLRFQSWDRVGSGHSLGNQKELKKGVERIGEAGLKKNVAKANDYDAEKIAKTVENRLLEFEIPREPGEDDKEPDELDGVAGENEDSIFGYEEFFDSYVVELTRKKLLAEILSGMGNQDAVVTGLLRVMSKTELKKRSSYANALFEDLHELLGSGGELNKTILQFFKNSKLSAKYKATLLDYLVGEGDKAVQKAAVDLLIDFSKDSNLTLKRAATKKLSEFESERGFARLSKIVHDSREDPATRSAALWGLDFKNKKSIEFLMVLCESANEGLRWRTLDFIAELRNVKLPARFVDQLIQNEDEKNDARLRPMANIIANSGDSRSVEVLKEMEKNGNYSREIKDVFKSAREYIEKRLKEVENGQSK